MQLMLGQRTMVNVTNDPDATRDRLDHLIHTRDVRPALGEPASPNGDA